MQTTITLTSGCLGDGRMMVRCDLRQAASPVEVSHDGGANWGPTQYQCADARHRLTGLEEIGQTLAAAAVGIHEAEAEECEIEHERPVMVEVATTNETIRICGGLEDFAGLEHSQIDEACEAYHRAATDALADAGRLQWCVPVGRRVLHSQWMGAKWEWSRGALGTMTAGLTPEECAAIDAAHDAGLEAARKVIAEAEPTRHQITSLQDEAAAAGDDAMQTICSAALDGDPVAVAEVARCLREAAAQSDK